MLSKSSFVIFVVSVATNLASPYYLWHGILLAQVVAAASGRHCSVSWNSCPTLHATIIMSLCLCLVNLVDTEALRLMEQVKVNIGRSFRLGGFESKDVLSSSAL